MIRVLVVDDEEGIRKNIERLLKLEGMEVATAANGHTGLVIAKSMLPDMIITDINMPVMDGFSLLEAIRNHHELSTTPVLMLTAAEDRANMRRGMSLGADDYITKPFRREELLDAIVAQRNKAARFIQLREQAVAKAVTQAEHRVGQMFRERYSQSLPKAGDSLPEAPTHALMAGTEMQASVVFADIRNFTTMAERLASAELAAALSQYFEAACQPIVAHGGTHLKMMGDGLMALFSGPPDAVGVTHAKRALLAALGLKRVAEGFAEMMRSNFGNRGLPNFEIGIGLHSGEVSLGKLGTGESSEITPLGDTVNIASRLQVASKELNWIVAASIDTVALAGSGIETGRDQKIQLRGRAAPISACEVVRIDDKLDLELSSVRTGVANFGDTDIDALRNAAKANSELTARAAKDALKQSLWSLQSGAFNQTGNQRFKGYRVLRKLGEGGMSDVHLARRDADDAEVVLKVLRTSGQNDADMLRRFIQEYAVLASIQHHHVARIYDQGFTDEYAFIAMEYLSGGTLKDAIAKGMDHERIVDLMRQIVSALHAIHSLGLVYRDLKPENMMFRHTGELVLVDFGIVKSVRDDAKGLVETHHGQIIGTPYYVSPEQATGREVTNRSDFYCLGVVLYEMLTRDKPYRADSLDMLLARHMYAAVPELPAEHAVFQPLLNKLMAKSPDDRPSDAQAIWHNLDIMAGRSPSFGDLPSLVKK
jgi:serine/threonine-protein kinase PpkA